MRSVMWYVSALDGIRAGAHVGAELRDRLGRVGSSAAYARTNFGAR